MWFSKLPMTPLTFDLQNYFDEIWGEHHEWSPATQHEWMEDLISSATNKK